MINKLLPGMAVLAVCALKAEAQMPIGGVHYAAGLEGIKGGSLPGPGIYARDDNFFYYGTSDLLPDYKSYIYQQAPGLLWMTPWKIIGADYGMDAMVPLIYNDTSYKTIQATFPSGQGPTLVTTGLNRFGLGDIEIEPLLLSWHLRQFDFRAGYGFWAPTGDYHNTSLVNLGDGAWTQMISLGGVWYPDHDKSWAFSILNHFEFNSQAPGTHLVLGTTFPTGGGGGGGLTFIPVPANIPCSTYTMEWGASKTIYKKTDVGIVGYFQEQFMYDTASPFNDSQVAAIGPEIRSEFPGTGWVVALRYEYQFLANNSPHGQIVDLMIRKGF
jgi:hypothetical protein